MRRGTVCCRLFHHRGRLPHGAVNVRRDAAKLHVSRAVICARGGPAVRGGHLRRAAKLNSAKSDRVDSAGCVLRVSGAVVIFVLGQPSGSAYELVGDKRGVAVLCAHGLRSGLAGVLCCGVWFAK